LFSHSSFFHNSLNFTNVHSIVVDIDVIVVVVVVVFALDQSNELIQLLQDKSLQKVILDITQSENAEVLLNEYLHKNESFFNFVEKMLSIIGLRDT
jgi:hypothetical protein